MAFSITQYNTDRNCYADRCIPKIGGQYDHILESHMDAFSNKTAEDAHIVVRAGYAADAADKAIVAVLEKYFGLRYNDGISYRTDLLNMNDAVGRASYRLVEFGFITNDNERKIFVSQMDNIAKDIAKALVKVGGKWLLIAGHGAGDPGAGAGGYNEATLVRQLNAKIVKYCNEITNGKASKKVTAKKATPKKTNNKRTETVKAKVYTYEIYTVKKSDTLWGVASTFNTTTEKLESLNKLKTRRLFIGQRLIISKKKNAPAKTKKRITANVKRKAPKVNNAKNLLTEAQAVAFIKSLKGNMYDFDRAYGAQCFDLANVYWNAMFRHGLKGVGAKDIPTWNDFTGEATVHANTPSFLAKPGDVVVWKPKGGSQYGHVAIVVAADLNTITVIEQNWLGGGLSMTEPATIRTHNYDFPMWFIRPMYR